MVQKTEAKDASKSALYIELYLSVLWEILKDNDKL